MTGWSGLNSSRVRGGGGSNRIAVIVPTALGRSNGRAPAAISYSTMPRLKMSLRPSTVLPRICSGDMYGAVPEIVPALETRRSLADCSIVAALLASPKSSTFTCPRTLIITFAGLMSRCTTPWLCASCSAEAISMATSMHAFSGMRSPESRTAPVGLFSSPCQLNGVEVLRMNERSGGASFEEVALPLFDALYNYARWLTGDLTEAEDLVQETYLKGLKGFGSFTPGTNFRAWMYRILRNTFLTSRTGLRAVPPISIDEDAELLEQMTDEETPEWHLLQRRSGEALRQAIEGLSLPFREVLLLCDVEEMSYKEIAETLSIPVGTVTSRLM